MGDIQKRPPIFLSSFFLNHPPHQIKPYHPHPSIERATQLGFYTGIAGTLVSAIHYGVIDPSHFNRGYLSKVTQSGVMAAILGLTLGGVTQMVANIREESDPWNATTGGCAAGFLIGLRAGKLPTAVGQCVLWGAVSGGVNYAGDTLLPANFKKSKQQQQEERVQLLGNQKDPLLFNPSS